MRTQALLFSILLSCIFVAVNAGKVVQLSSRNFDQTLRKSDADAFLIEFYAPWCGHCKTFEPTYEVIAESLSKEKDRKVEVYKVDGSSERALSSRFNVRGFPSIFLVDGWDVYEFKGRRDHDKIVIWALKGYKNNKAIPFLHSPYGFVGLGKSCLMRLGNYMMDIHLGIVRYGVSDAVAGGIIILGVISGTLVMMIVSVYLLEKHMERKAKAKAKAKTD